MASRCRFTPTPRVESYRLHPCYHFEGWLCTRAYTLYNKGGTYTTRPYSGDTSYIFFSQRKFVTHPNKNIVFFRGTWCDDFTSSSRLPHGVRFACLYHVSCSKLPLSFGKKSKFRKATEGNRSYDRDTSIVNIDWLRDHDFKRLYRLDRPTYHNVSLKISPLLEKNSSMARRNFNVVSAVRHLATNPQFVNM